MNPLKDIMLFPSFSFQVTFLITEDPSKTRVKREMLAPDRFNLYVSLAYGSGGQIIFTDNENIKQVAEIIGESTISTVKTLFKKVLCLFVLSLSTFERHI